MPYKKEMSDLYSRLKEAGFERRYVLETILPDWWEDKLAKNPANRQLAEISIARALNLPLAALADRESALTPPALDGERFLKWSSTDTDKLIPAVAVIRQAARLLIEATPALPETRPSCLAPSELRKRILSQHKYVTLEALLEASWSAGIPVVHVASLPKGAKRVDGLAMRVDERPVIALATSHQPPAFLIWHLAHELGHIHLGHLDTQNKLDVTIEAGSEAPEEVEANRYAAHLVYGDPDFGGFWAHKHIKGTDLALQASSLAEQHQILPASIVLSYGFTMENAWGAARIGLQRLGEAEGGPQSVHRALEAHIDPSLLSDTDLHFFLKATGLPEQ